MSNFNSRVRALNCAACMVSIAAMAAISPLAASSEKDPINPPPTLQDWQVLAKLPDFSGIWTPVISDQFAQERTNPPPWKPQIAKQIEQMYADERAGRPFPVIDHCFPVGMPSYMLITHNAFELLLTPGRVTLLGEGDGNRLRRIYTDGRSHPADPDPSFHGHSIGRWDGQTLVVDTIAVLPQTYLAVNEAVGLPNDGDLHIAERLHLLDADTLADDLEITANKLLTKAWKTTRKYRRHREQKFDLAEGNCEQEAYREGVDKNGHAIFEPVKFHNGVPVGSDK